MLQLSQSLVGHIGTFADCVLLVCVGCILVQMQSGRRVKAEAEARSKARQLLVIVCFLLVGFLLPFTNLGRYVDGAILTSSDTKEDLLDTGVDMANVFGGLKKSVEKYSFGVPATLLDQGRSKLKVPSSLSSSSSSSSTSSSSSAAAPKSPRVFIM